MPETLRWDNLEPLLTDWGWRVAGAVVVLLVGWIAVKLVVAALNRVMRRTQLDEIVVQFLATVCRVGLWAIVVVFVIEKLGFQTTSLIAALGAVGLAVGLALKDSLSNFAAGLTLVAQRPFAVDDFVDAGGTSGIVEDIGLITTTLRTPDNRSVIVPNGSIYQDVIVNYSARERRRVDMVFGIAYGDDIDAAKRVIREVLSADERILEDPAPVIAVNELADSSVNLVVRPWVATADYWDVFWDTSERMKVAFDEAGLSIPFPQSEVYLHQVA